MNNAERLNQLIIGLEQNYQETPFTSQLGDMFSRKKELIEAYLKPGREFWYYDDVLSDYRKLKVTYTRSGVVFFVFEDEPDVEHAWFTGSYNCFSLYAAQIYPYEIGNLMSRQYENAAEDIPKICEKCKWYDCEGRIKVEVIWDK